METEVRILNYSQKEQLRLSDPKYPHILDYDKIEPVQYDIELSPEIEELISRRERLLAEYKSLREKQREVEEQENILKTDLVSQKDIQIIEEVYGSGSVEAIKAKAKFDEINSKFGKLPDYTEKIYIKENALQQLEKLINDKIFKANEDFYELKSGELLNMIEDVITAFKASAQKYEEFISAYKGLLKFSSKSKLSRPIGMQGLVSPTTFIEKLNNHLRDVRHWIHKKY